MELNSSIIEYFTELPDPRAKTHSHYRHTLVDILVIALLATLCGADTWAEIERYGLAKESWLRTFLFLPYGIPSHDTFSRVLSRLDPTIFHDCFLKWIQSLNIDLKKQIIALDGKVVRGSGTKISSALHLVSAWATNERMMLAQVKTSDKSNEITAFPELLKMIDIEGAIVTIDAMGAQKKIAKQIRAQDADYVLNLKANHKTLFDNVKKVFEVAEADKLRPYKNMLNARRIRKDKNCEHGRHETKIYTLISPREGSEFAIRWPGLKSIGRVETLRKVGDTTTPHTRYFLTSLEHTQIEQFINAVKKHWQIEIELHWSLDVAFQEDHSQIHMGHAAENLALIRRIALNLLKQEKTHKNGIKCRRKTAGWDHEYLLKVLQVDEDFLDYLGSLQ